MLKRQAPHDVSLYTAVDPRRITELHRKGFFPEYLYGQYVYFRTSEKLIAYLNGEDIDAPKVKIKINEPKIESIKTRTEKTKEKSSVSKYTSNSKPKEDTKE